MTADIAKPIPMLSGEQLAEMKSFDDAIAALSEAGIGVSSVTDYGDGFEVLPKADFVNVKFLIVDYKIVPAEKSDYGTDFAVVRIVSVDGRKALLTDGGSGLCAQIMELQRRGIPGGVMCEKGLVASEYDYVDGESGKKTPATTYYLAGM